MSRSNTSSNVIKDERWVIKTFRPLLKQLKVQDIPPPLEERTIQLADNPMWIRQNMGMCEITIEQQILPSDTGGILITYHETQYNYFTLHIIINSNLCNKTNMKMRIEQKATAVHEFTHAVAALSAISRLSSDSKELIKRLKDLLKRKVPIYYEEIKQLVAELNNSIPMKFFKLVKFKKFKFNKKKYFPDNHYRLGFEDFPVSYPAIFEELLFSEEIFNEYFSQDTIDTICEHLLKKELLSFFKLITPVFSEISEKKALSQQFVTSRALDIITQKYIDHLSLKRKKSLL